MKRMVHVEMNGTDYGTSDEWHSLSYFIILKISYWYCVAEYLLSSVHSMHS